MFREFPLMGLLLLFLFVSVHQRSLAVPVLGHNRSRPCAVSGYSFANESAALCRHGESTRFGCSIPRQSHGLNQALTHCPASGSAGGAIPADRRNSD